PTQFVSSGEALGNGGFNRDVRRPRDSCPFDLYVLNLVFLLQYSFLELVLVLRLDRPAGEVKRGLATKNIILQLVRSDVILCLRLPKLAEHGTQLVHTGVLLRVRARRLSRL